MAAIEEEIGEDGKGVSEDTPLSSVKKQPQIEEEEDDEDDDDDVMGILLSLLSLIIYILPPSLSRSRRPSLSG